MQHILPEELPRLNCFLPAARVKAPGEIAPTHESIISKFLFSLHFPKCTVLSHCAERKWLHTDSTHDCMKKLWFFLPANKTRLSHSVLLPTCSILRVRLLKSASNYDQLPEEWPFSFASVYQSRTDISFVSISKVCHQINHIFTMKAKLCLKHEINEVSFRDSI